MSRVPGAAGAGPRAAGGGLATAHGGLAPGTAEGFRRMWRQLSRVGRAPSGGYRRFAWTGTDRELARWFAARAEERGLRHEVDRNGNQWAWLGDPARGGAVATGSHLDSVPDGGAFDGPLGVVSAFAALDELRARGVAGRRPLGVVRFADEEGARFGVACVGSRLSCGRLDPDAARALRDADGVTLAEAVARAGHDPAGLGADPERLAGLAAFVELHIEQGRALADLGHPVALGSWIRPHGRWRFDFHGVPDHAGTTRIEDRRDPMLTYAHTVLSARKRARLAGALATFGRIEAEPGAVNAVPGLVRGWLDARADEETALDTLVAGIERAARERGERDGVRVAVTRESHTPKVVFSASLRDTLAGLLGELPQLPTGAGHDAGVLAGTVPTAMLYVRNPTGVSHAPAEHAEPADCLAGVAALATALEGLVCR